MARENMGAGFMAAQNGGWEPQRQSAFAVEIYGLNGGTTDISLAVDTASLPNLTFGEIELNHGNERVWVAGGVTFETVSLVCKDMVDRNIMAMLYAWQALVYNPANGRIGFAKDYKKKAAIFLYGPDGGSERKWELRGCWPQAMNYGSTLDQSAKEAVSQIEMTLRYDKAVPVTLVPGAAQGLGVASGSVSGF